MPSSAEKQRQTAAKEKYVELGPDCFVVNYYGDAAIRPIDLATRSPDRLKEFASMEAALAFEEECYLKKKEMLAKKQGIAEYNRIPKSQLTISDIQKPPRPTSEEQHAESRSVAQREGADTRAHITSQVGQLKRHLKAQLNRIEHHVTGKAANTEPASVDEKKEVDEDEVDGDADKQVDGDHDKQVDGYHDKQVDGDTDKQVEAKEKSDSSESYSSESDSDKQVDGGTDKQVDGDTNKQVDGDTNKQVDEDTDKQVDGDTDKQVAVIKKMRMMEVGKASKKQVMADNEKPVEAYDRELWTDNEDLHELMSRKGLQMVPKHPLVMDNVKECFEHNVIMENVGEPNMVGIPVENIRAKDKRTMEQNAIWNFQQIRINYAEAHIRQLEAKIAALQLTQACQE